MSVTTSLSTSIDVLVYILLFRVTLLPFYLSYRSRSVLATIQRMCCTILQIISGKISTLFIFFSKSSVNKTIGRLLEPQVLLLDFHVLQHEWVYLVIKVKVKELTQFLSMRVVRIISFTLDMTLRILCLVIYAFVLVQIFYIVY